MQSAYSILESWIPLALLATILSLLAYVLVQQDLRISANSPQIQMAEDAATSLANGKDPLSIVPRDSVDISGSLSPYLTIFDDDGKIIVSTANLGGKIPVIPSGVFKYVKRYGEDRFTWQPEAGVRQAVVVIRYIGQGQSGFVLAGRSLREVERQINSAGFMTAFAWAGAMVTSLGAISLLRIFSLKTKNA